MSESQRNDLPGIDEMLAADRALDAIGSGHGAVPEDDALYSLLAAARAEADTAIPAPPTVATAPATRRFRFARRAAAAGGVSLTTMAIAGGVAAAITIGGLGYAVQNTPNVLPAPPTSEESTTVPAPIDTTNQGGVAVEPQPKRAPAPAPEPTPEHQPAPTETAPASPAPTGTVLPSDSEHPHPLPLPTGTEQPEPTSTTTVASSSTTKPKADAPSGKPTASAAVKKS